MAAFLISDEGVSRFRRSNLTEGFSESWLQEMLFREPELLPLSELEPSAGVFIPICRELAFPKIAGNVYLDIFGITPTGRPILVECKLWRNPQARREVIAQILEYSALLRRWTYSDLISKLKSKLGWVGVNPLHEYAAARGGLQNETLFTDAVSRNLRNGDFHLIIAGDGIREDAAAIVEHIGENGTRLSLVEFQLWADENGKRLLVPSISLRTEIVRQRILVDSNGNTLRIESGESRDDPKEVLSASRKRLDIAVNREFWQAFIKGSSFDHPEQSPPRNGGNNWVKIALPSPGRWITAYRLRGRAGLYLVEEEGSGLTEYLVAEKSALQEEFGLEPIRFQSIDQPDRVSVSVDQPDWVSDQLSWLIDASNRLVNALRPRISEFNRRR